MTRFSINTDSITSCEEQLQNSSANLRERANRMANSANTTIHTLDQRSGLIISRNILKMSDVLFTVAAQMDSLEEGLSFIIRAYSDADETTAQFMESVLTTGSVKKGASQNSAEVTRVQERTHDLAMQNKVFDTLNASDFSKEKWQQASIEERKQILTNIIIRTATIMGIAAPSIISFESLDKTTRGYFSDESDKITINGDLISKSDSYSLVNTAIHETRHAYQYQVINHPERFQVSKETIKQWKENWDHYRSPGETAPDGHTYTYDEYYVQPIEWDAKNFARQTGDLHKYTPEYRGSWE